MDTADRITEGFCCALLVIVIPRVFRKLNREGDHLANHKSAIKRARTSLRRNAINSRTMGTVRTLEKKLRKALAGKNKDESAKALVEFSSKLGKAAQKGRIPVQTASRKISRLSKQLAAL